MARPSCAARRRSLLDGVLEGASSVLGSLFTGGIEQPDPESQACQSEQSALLLRCLHALPEKYRSPRRGPHAPETRHKPGRYEFRVSHASDDRHINEHFVVEAEH